MEKKRFEEQVNERKREGAKVVRAMNDVLSSLGRKEGRKQREHPRFCLSGGSGVKRSETFDYKTFLEYKGLELVRDNEETYRYYSQYSSYDYSTKDYMKFSAKYKGNVVLRTDEMCEASCLFNSDGNDDLNLDQLGEHIKVYRPSQDWLKVFNTLAKKTQKMKEREMKELEADRKVKRQIRERKQRTNEVQLKKNFGL